MLFVYIRRQKVIISFVQKNRQIKTTTDKYMKNLKIRKKRNNANGCVYGYGHSICKKK